jgi:hypothetical protein
MLNFQSPIFFFSRKRLAFRVCNDTLSKLHKWSLKYHHFINLIVEVSKVSISTFKYHFVIKSFKVIILVLEFFLIYTKLALYLEFIQKYIVVYHNIIFSTVI